MGRRRDVDGRELVLAAAVKLFAEQGIEAVSIRAVNREAGLGPASVHYHFGTKEALLDAVLRRHGDAVADRIRTRASQLSVPGTRVDARDIVTMLAEPYVDLISGTHEGQAWAQIMGQVLQHDPDQALDRPSLKATWKVAARVYPEASSTDVRRAVRMCLVLLVTQIGQISRHRRRSLDVDLLIDFLAGGLDAALSRPVAVGRDSA